eukprot:jgi/Mesvir1/8400/Mv12642-RA.3
MCGRIIRVVFFLLVAGLLGFGMWLAVSNHNRSLRDLEAEDAQLRQNLAKIESDLAVLRHERNQAEARVRVQRQQLRELEARKTSQRGELAHLLGEGCPLDEMEKRHKSDKQFAAARIEQEMRPMLDDQLATARRELTKLHSTVADASAKLEADSALLANLTASLKARLVELDVGRALLSIDTAFITGFLRKMVTLNYAGSFVMNAEALPRVGESLIIPRWNLGHEDLGPVTPALRGVVPTVDPWVKPQPLIYKSCAVVANSGIHLFYKRGDAIDDHEAVIRFNAAPAQGFEEFVGSKTTIRFVNRLHFGHQENPLETVMQQVATPDTLARFVAAKQELPALRLFAIAPEFHSHVLQELAIPATSGLYGILFALQRCRKVDLYGYFRGSIKHVPYHYFDSDEPVTGQRDRDLLEGPLLLELVRRSEGRMALMEACQMPEGETSTGVRFMVPACDWIFVVGFCLWLGSSGCGYVARNSLGSSFLHDLVAHCTD